MHIHSSQYNYILHGLPDVTLQSTQLEMILHGLREIMSDRQVISHNPSVTSLDHTFVEIDHEIISTAILPPSAESFKKGCCQLQAKVCA